MNTILALTLIGLSGAILWTLEKSCSPAKMKFVELMRWEGNIVAARKWKSRLLKQVDQQEFCGYSHPTRRT